ncbi:MAG: HPr family phosphocarrier protein [Deferribacteraceae bacterium]|jgi:phosphocarrier protein|nr:HPr family phosphocarrier protein [Deferribacteraceae bacterium]
MSSTIVQNVKLVNELGMHARAAAQFVKKAGEFKSEIKIRKNNIEVNGKSILGLLMLAMPVGDTFEIQATGGDASEAVNALTDLVSARFGESK